MRKLLSVLLSVAMTICVLQVAYVQVTALENENNNYSTVDEANTDIEPVSVEVIKAPESVIMTGGRVYDAQNFWTGVDVLVKYSDGVEEICNCKDVTPMGFVPLKHKLNGAIRVEVYESQDDNAIIYVDFDDCDLSTKYEIKRVKFTHPYGVLKCELTKLPNKIFAFPLWSGTLDNEDELKVENSISNNMNGAELTVRYASGKNKILTFGKEIKPINSTKRSTEYSVKFDDYNTLTVIISDLGNYEASVYLTVESNIDELEGNIGEFFRFKAKSVDNSNPAKPSGNISSATSDVATNDNANNNNSTNGTANNGVVATGNFATPAIITVVMLSAVAVMFVFKRKRMF